MTSPSEPDFRVLYAAATEQLEAQLEDAVEAGPARYQIDPLFHARALGVADAVARLAHLKSDKLDDVPRADLVRVTLPEIITYLQLDDFLVGVSTRVLGFSPR